MSLPRLAGAAIGAVLSFTTAAAQDAQNLGGLKSFAEVIARRDQKPQDQRKTVDGLMKNSANNWLKQLQAAAMSPLGQCAKITHNVEEDVKGKNTIVATYTMHACLESRGGNTRVSINRQPRDGDCTFSAQTFYPAPSPAACVNR